jgi:hypothetical protein
MKTLTEVSIYKCLKDKSKIHQTKNWGHRQKVQKYEGAVI